MLLNALWSLCSFPVPLAVTHVPPPMAKGPLARAAIPLPLAQPFPAHRAKDLHGYPGIWSHWCWAGQEPVLVCVQLPAGSVQGQKREMKGNEHVGEGAAPSASEGRNVLQSGHTMLVLPVPLLPAPPAHRNLFPQGPLGTRSCVAFVSRAGGLCPAGACLHGPGADQEAQPEGFQPCRSQPGAQSPGVLWFQPRGSKAGVSQRGGPSAAGRDSVGGSIWTGPAPWPIIARSILPRAHQPSRDSWPRPEPISDGFIAPQPISFR